MPREQNSRGAFPVLSRDPNLSGTPPDTLSGKRIRLLKRTMVVENGWNQPLEKSRRAISRPSFPHHLLEYLR